MEEVFIKSRDGYELELHIFKVKNSNSVVQLIHGMEEHQERYEPFINFLNEKGISVVSSNMRGHGKNAPFLGYFKDKKGYEELIEDQKTITEYIENNFKNHSVFIFAHSMGTIITRVLLEDYSKHYDKVVLSGYPNYQIASHIGIVISNIIKLIKGPKYKSKFLSKLSIEQFNKKIKNPETKIDWICKDKKVLEDYKKDPYCGFGFTCSAYNDLYHLVIKMHKAKNYKNINKNLKLLMLRGLEDPCVGGENGATDSRSILNKAGFSNIEHIDYPNMRHELLGESGKEKIYNDILKFYLDK